MTESPCLFCQIAGGKIEAKKVWENDAYFALDDKYPKAPVHILVLPKAHLSKKQTAQNSDQSHWGDLMAAVFEVIRLKNLDSTGFEVISYGGGYNHFDHEHIHILGGSKKQPTA